eukprot:6184923-Pleurochrysis_carterae.AAC.3
MHACVRVSTPCARRMYSLALAFALRSLGANTDERTCAARMRALLTSQLPEQAAVSLLLHLSKRKRVWAPRFSLGQTTCSIHDEHLSFSRASSCPHFSLTHALLHRCPTSSATASPSRATVPPSSAAGATARSARSARSQARPLAHSTCLSLLHPNQPDRKSLLRSNIGELAHSRLCRGGVFYTRELPCFSVLRSYQHTHLCHNMHASAH